LAAGWELGPVDRAAGGLIASLEHLVTWSRFQWTGRAPDGTTLLSRESLDRLHTPVVNVNACEDVALDWTVTTTDGATSIGHGGVTAGYISDLVVFPAREVAFVGLTNATNGAIVNQTVRRFALDRVAGIRETDPEPDPTRTGPVDRLLGRYLSPFGVLSVAAGEAPGTIHVTSTVREDTDGWKPPVDPPMSFAPFAADQYVSLDAPGPARVIRFPLDGDRPGWVLWTGRRSPRID
jgi:hypothetical protein